MNRCREPCRSHRITTCRHIGCPWHSRSPDGLRNDASLRGTNGSEHSLRCYWQLPLPWPLLRTRSSTSRLDGLRHVGRWRRELRRCLRRAAVSLRLGAGRAGEPGVPAHCGCIGRSPQGQRPVPPDDLRRPMLTVFRARDERTPAAFLLPASAMLQVRPAGRTCPPAGRT